MRRLITTATLAALAMTAAQSNELRVVSAGGAITETIYALGAEEALVGVDSSSIFPEAATKLPQVGYLRALSAEGVLSLNPTLLLTTEDAGPPPVLQQLEQVGTQILRLPEEHTPGAVAERTLRIAEVLQLPQERAEEVNAAMAKDLEAAQEHVRQSGSRPSVLFIYARAGGLMNVGGANTSANAIIELAGGVNAAKAIDGFKPLTAEAAVAAAPEVILITTRGLQAAGGVDGLLRQPGLELTPAGKARRVIAMDDLLLLGFGPRVGQAALELSRALHPQAVTAVAAP